MATTSQVVNIQTIHAIKKNAAFTLRLPFVAQGTPLFKVTPTIAAGDVKVSKDGGAFANVANLPAETPANGTIVEVALTAGEMNADVVVVRGIDAAGDEWADWSVTIYTTAVTVDDLVRATTPANALTVDANGNVGTASLRRNTAQGGAASSVTLDAGASATDDLYNGLRVDLVGGVGAGQARKITDYDGTTKVATVEPAWTTNPDATSVFELRGDARSSLLNDAVNTNSLADNTLNSNKIATDAIGGAQVAESALIEIQGKILSDATPFPGARVDAAITTRADGSVYTAPRGANLDRLDALVSSRVAAADLTPARAAALDFVDVPVSSRVSAASLTPTRASALDRLDVLVSSRAATGDAMTLAAAAIDAAQVTAAAANKVADHHIRRNLVTARASANGDALTKRSPLGAYSRLTNKVNVNGAQLEIFDETDAGTPFAKFNLVGDSAATPIKTATPAA